MKLNEPNLFIEINNYEILFLAVDISSEDKFNLIIKEEVPIQGIQNKKITDLELFYNTIKKNIYSLEQKINFVFKEIILVINNFDYSFINLTGYKNLNGSQLGKENVTYILNSLKAKISETESNKTILHIFNTNYFLDKKNIENIPIGLFGDFYSHELSFCLINNNDLNNLQNIFKKCNLRVKKIILKNFIDGANIIQKNKENTFFKIKIDKTYTQIFFFENSALKFSQDFSYGTNIIINDISKITALKKEVIENILQSLEFKKDKKNNELIEKKFFEDKNFRNIKKNLILEVARARIKELSETILLKNINISNTLKKNVPIFLTLSSKSNVKYLEDSFDFYFSNKNNLNLKFVNDFSPEILYESANQIVKYGWNKEAIPVTQNKHSIITRIFKSFFG